MSTDKRIFLVFFKHLSIFFLSMITVESALRTIYLIFVSTNFFSVLKPNVGKSIRGS